MNSIPDSSRRFEQVAAAASLEPVSAPRLIESLSNDAWLLDDARLGSVVLRVAWRGDVTRLGREAEVARRMPAGIRRPEVLADGETTVEGFPLAYSLTRRLTGQALDTRWASLTLAERRSAVSRLSEMLRELHRWSPEAGLAERLCARTGLEHGGISGLLGADIMPLPLTRALALAAHAETLPYVDPGLIKDAAELIGELRHLEPVVDDPSAHGLIHGDLYRDNLWWSEDGTLVMMDFEWVRFGPPLLDLRCLCENADKDALRGIEEGNPTVLRWLWSDYPELFEESDAAERMRLYALVYAIRHLIVSPLDRSPDGLPPFHAFHRLRRLVEGTWPHSGSLPGPLTTAGR